MKKFFVGMLLMLISFGSYAEVACWSYCISTNSDFAVQLYTGSRLEAKEISELQATVIGVGSHYNFKELLNECKIKVKRVLGESADGILVQFSANTGLLIAQNPTDGCLVQ